VVSISAFSDRYRRLRGVAPGVAEVQPSAESPYYYVNVPYYASNLGDATLYGGEAWIAWQPKTRLKIRPSVSRCLETFRYGAENIVTLDAGQSPTWQVSLRCDLDLLHNLELDGNYRYVSPIEAQMIPAYQTVDARVGWRLKPNLELSLVGRNLLKKSHPEFTFNLTPMPLTEIERSVSARLTWGW
jgi:iron complex outermembrane receptor protein